jgi:hypothetical protein
MTHTPTPWHVFDDKAECPGIEAENVTIVVFGDKLTITEDCGVQGETAEEARANAAFIVRAVNSHDALVEALEAAQAALNGTEVNSFGLRNHITNTLIFARQKART